MNTNISNFTATETDTMNGVNDFVKQKIFEWHNMAWVEGGRIGRMILRNEDYDAIYDKWDDLSNSYSSYFAFLPEDVYDYYLHFLVRLRMLITKELDGVDYSDTKSIKSMISTLMDDLFDIDDTLRDLVFS